MLALGDDQLPMADVTLAAANVRIADHAVAERAGRYGMIVQLGPAESALDGNLVFNSTTLISLDSVIGVHRKVHNQAGALFFEADEQAPAFDTPVARVVSLICNDLAFPSSCGFSRCAAPRSR
jgi:predicted amidohydrolase